MLSESLTINELLKYKNLNKTMLPEVEEFINKMKKEGFKITNNYKTNINEHRKENIYTKNNLITNKKFNKDDNERLYYKFRSILNKLSESNFNELAKELINLQIINKEHLIKLVELIVLKAIGEIKFSKIYAKLSKKLISYYVEENDKKIYFRELLINKCQQLFDGSTSLDKNIEESQIDKNFNLKEEILGSIIFIGELYNQEILTNKIIYNCLFTLFTKINLNKAYIIDSLCTLIKIVGKEFFKKNPKEAIICIEKLEKLKDDNNIQIKEKFAIMDIIDLIKKEKWLK